MPKLQIFDNNFTRDTPSELLDAMCKYEMDPASIVENIERTRFCPQTDRLSTTLKSVRVCVGGVGGGVGWGGGVGGGGWGGGGVGGGGGYNKKNYRRCNMILE